MIDELLQVFENPKKTIPICYSLSRGEKVTTIVQLSDL